MNIACVSCQYFVLQRAWNAWIILLYTSTWETGRRNILYFCPQSTENNFLDRNMDGEPFYGIRVDLFYKPVYYIYRQRKYSIRLVKALLWRLPQEIVTTRSKISGLFRRKSTERSHVPFWTWCGKGMKERNGYIRYLLHLTGHPWDSRRFLFCKFVCQPSMPSLLQFLHPRWDV